MRSLTCHLKESKQFSKSELEEIISIKHSHGSIYSAKIGDKFNLDVILHSSDGLVIIDSYGMNSKHFEKDGFDLDLVKEVIKQKLEEMK